MAHQESWDPKPEAPLEYRGPFGVAKTAIRGVVFNENFSRLAKVADKMTVIRSIAGKEADHGRASYAMFTGYRKSPAIDHPSLGAVVAHELGPRHNLPPYVAVPTAGEYAGTGYLGSQFGPFGIGSDPGRSNYQVRDLLLPPGVDEQRFSTRQRIRGVVDEHFRAMAKKAEALARWDEFYQRAYAMISSPAAREAFDITQESAKTKELYGQNEAGMRFLLARRLIEAGVRFVTVSYGGWDHHAGIETAMRRQGPTLDQAVAGLISDLDDRGMLDSTLVMVTSEFGRTPKINATVGRDHYPRLLGRLRRRRFQTRLGLRFVQQHRQRTGRQRRPDRRNVLTTVYKQIGINADKELMTPRSPHRNHRRRRSGQRTRRLVRRSPTTNTLPPTPLATSN
jgi:hypothetical protein